jgi:galactose mutarotase-like enzyme
MNGANVLIRDKTKNILQDDTILPLTRGLFEDGALVFRNIHSEKISLRSKAADKKVVLYVENMPNLGIWQAKDAPFVCMEPWHGIAEATDFTDDLTQKVGIIQLRAGETYKTEYSIIIA